MPFLFERVLPQRYTGTSLSSFPSALILKDFNITPFSRRRSAAVQQWVTSTYSSARRTDELESPLNNFHELSARVYDDAVREPVTACGRSKGRTRSLWGFCKVNACAVWLYSLSRGTFLTRPACLWRVTFEKLRVLRETCSSEPLARFLRFDLCNGINKQFFLRFIYNTWLQSCYVRWQISVDIKLCYNTFQDEL